MGFDYTNFAFYGFIILLIVYLYYLKQNLNKGSLIIFGSLLVTVGYFFAVQEKYDDLKNKKSDDINKSHLFLGSFKLLSFVFPINKNIKKTDLIGLIGNIILVNKNFGYELIGSLFQVIFYSIYTFRNSMKHNLIDNSQSIGGGLVLLYYIKKSIDISYKKKEELLNKES